MKAPGRDVQLTARLLNKAIQRVIWAVRYPLLFSLTTLISNRAGMAGFCLLVPTSSLRRCRGFAFFNTLLQLLHKMYNQTFLLGSHQGYPCDYYLAVNIYSMLWKYKLQTTAKASNQFVHSPIKSVTALQGQRNWIAQLDSDPRIPVPCTHQQTNQSQPRKHENGTADR